MKNEESDCVCQAFKEGVLFTDGGLLLYNALNFPDVSTGESV